MKTPPLPKRTVGDIIKELAQINQSRIRLLKEKKEYDDNSNLIQQELNATAQAHLELHRELDEMTAK